MNRAERRRQAKEIAKYGTAQQTRLVPTAIVTNDGTRYKSYEDWLHAVEEDVVNQASKRASEVASEMLYETEIYMTVHNVMAMLIAVERTVGNLKTVQRSYQKIIEAYNDASDYIDQTGLKCAYQEFHDRYGLELDFDEVDMNWVDDDGKEVYERLKIRMGTTK